MPASSTPSFFDPATAPASAQSPSVPSSAASTSAAQSSSAQSPSAPSSAATASGATAAPAAAPAPYAAGTGSVPVNADRDAFARMGYRERLALKREDPAGYAALRSQL